MAVSYSMKGIVGYKQSEQKLQYMKNFGFDHIVLDMGIQYTPYMLEKWGETEEEPADFSELYTQLKVQAMKSTAVKAPMLCINTERWDLTEVMLDLVKKSIDVARRTNADYVIVQPVFAGIAKEDEEEVNRKYFLALGEYCKGSGVRILLQNQYKDFRGHMIRGIGCDAREVVRWITNWNRELGEEWFGFCLDIGVCTILGIDIQSMIELLGDNLKAVILRDCDGVHDSALVPFSCVQGGQWITDWLGLVRGLRSIDFEGKLILDMCHSVSRLSPRLRNSFMVYVKEVVDYLEWQIHMEKVLNHYSSIVLFGAGKMCGHFMEYYGEQYPPLFTCDNNSKLWGSKAFGLEVREPKALLELPKDCGVIICNVYYKEITQQLREMGICNIAYYNDEFSPSEKEDEDV